MNTITDHGRPATRSPEPSPWPECCPDDTVRCSICDTRLCGDAACAPEPHACLEPSEDVHCDDCRTECRSCIAEARAEAGCPR